ncbi:MAG TPA: UDP-glucose 4-epimerase GalE [Bacteroidia bacterium]|nr:UDP-glucose 4-epimerase GalE [Bacteroidia bacterium]
MSAGNILVTGGTGYIGSLTVVELQQTGYDVFIIDNLSNSHIGVLDEVEKISGMRPHFSKIDLCNRELLKDFFTRNSIDAVIHFAAFKSVSESVKEPLKYYRNNILSLINLLEFVSEFSVPHFIFSSSCTVYGEPDYVPVDEKHPVKSPSSPYGATKQMCEKILSDISASSNVKVISLRYFNPAGAHPSVLIGELPLNEPTNLVPVITRTAIGKIKEMIVYGNDYNTPDGSCIRDYIHVTDVASAHVSALERMTGNKTKNNFEIFNLGTGNGCTVLEVINTFEKVTGKKLNYKIGKRREGDVSAIYSDCKLANKELKWKAEGTLEEMLLSAWEGEQKMQD